jgi:hypothetical protein
VVLLVSPDEPAVQRGVCIAMRYLQSNLPRFGVEIPDIEQCAINEDDFIVPVDCAIRRPDPKGPRRACRNTLSWMQTMLDKMFDKRLDTIKL